jgi:phosphatidylserine decarboxylase
LPVSCFDPVLVEASLGFVVAGLCRGSIRLGSAMGQTVRRGLLLGFASFGPLSRGSKIDNIAHQVARR